MSTLGLINMELQQIVESISPIVGVEVAVYDDDHFVIAATITNEHVTPGMKLKDGEIIKYVMRTGKTLINKYPREHQVCQPCSLKETCPEYGDISCPIIIEDKIIGMVSFTAFDEVQRKKLLDTQKELLGFVSKLSKLIGSLVFEKELIREKDLTMQKMETILNSINDGIISIDENGQLINYNKLAIKRLGYALNSGEATPSDLMKQLKLNTVLNTGEPVLNREVRYNIGENYINLMTSVLPILEQNNVVGAVSVIRDMEEVHGLVNELTTSQNLKYTMSDIITHSPLMLKLKEDATRIARNNSTILITGESGTGKELLSRAIHNASPRANKPFVAINCAAIPEALLESELFGYEEGAFTGAGKKGKPGKFELAHGGTLFLDEIGDMSLGLQAKLLRAVEDQQIERIGGTTPVQMDIRIIAATNKNLEKMVEEKEFREDLFFRLNVIPLRIPPLRERPEDISLLLEYFLDKLQINSHNKSFSEEALKTLNNYNWPGNVRELSNCVEYAMNIQSESLIDIEDLPPRIRKKNNENKNIIRYEGAQNYEILTIEEMERQLIIKALDKYGWSHEGKTNAAKVLGIHPSTLYRKIKRYNIEN